MTKILDFLSGKKSYIIIVLAAAGAIAQQAGYEVPEIVWQLIGLAGLGAARSAMKKIQPEK